MNQFLAQSTKNDVRTGNGAISNSTSGNLVLDYFAECGSYRNRTTAEVAASMGAIFGEDPYLGLKTVFYNRMITRKVKGIDSDSVQRGQGNRDEFAKSLSWLDYNHPSYLYDNLWLVPLVGRWSDLWYDSPSTGVQFYPTKIEKVFSLIAKGLEDDNQRALIAKYLPKIRSKKKIKGDRHRRLNAFARGLCRYMDWSEKDYRQFKSNPANTAHLFQRKMCAGEWDGIDFNTIPGKALFNLIKGKGKDGKNALTRHNLDNSYLKWLESQPVAKFNGYPFELYMAAKNRNRSLVETFTYNKQFDNLIKTAKDGVPSKLLQRGVLCALDTSGSMGDMGYYGNINTRGTNYQPIDVCVGLGIYFSSLLEGYFKDHVVMFDSKSRMLRLRGNFCDKVEQIPANAMGGTNFQSVIDEIVRVRTQNPNIPVSDYPEVLLVVSDMQFNPSGGYSWNGRTGNDEKTNYKVAMDKLKAVGLPEMTIIWWNVNGYGNDVPSTMDDAGTVLISGNDGAIISSILGMDDVIDEVTGETRKATPYEQMVNALEQDVLNLIRVQ